MNEVLFIPVKRHSSSGSTESPPADSGRNVVGRATLCGAANVLCVAAGMPDCWLKHRPRPTTAATAE